MPRADQTPQKIQGLLAQAERLLGQAAALADEIGQELTFRGQRYTPSQVLPGKWESEEPPENWNPSGDMRC